MALQWVCMAAAAVGAAAMLRLELQKHIEHAQAEVRGTQLHVWPCSSCHSSTRSLNFGLAHIRITVLQHFLAPASSLPILAGCLPAYLTSHFFVAQYIHCRPCTIRVGRNHRECWQQTQAQQTAGRSQPSCSSSFSSCRWHSSTGAAAAASFPAKGI
jgi:hypothetical protein